MEFVSSFTDSRWNHCSSDTSCDRPEGDICDVVSNASTGEVSEEPVNAPDAPVVSVPDASKVPLSESEEEALLIEILQGQGDAATLRNLLIQAGMDERLLNQLSDEDLLNSYQEVLGQ